MVSLSQASKIEKLTRWQRLRGGRWVFFSLLSVESRSPGVQPVIFTDEIGDKNDISCVFLEML